MTSPSAFPILIQDDVLHFGKVKIPLRDATSFSVRDKTTHEIEICKEHGKETILVRLFLERGKNMHNCIKALLEYKKIKASILSVRSIKPEIVPGPIDKEKNVAFISITFHRKKDLNYFYIYFLPLIENCISLSRNREGIPTVEIIMKRSDTVCNQIKKIQKILKIFIDHYMDTRINEALIENNDPRFPPILETHKMSVDCDLKCLRTYHATSNEAFEIFRLVDSSCIKLTTGTAIPDFSKDQNDFLRAHKAWFLYHLSPRGQPSLGST